MRILSITAGAASMICGSCLRDNALAAEMIREGHDVVLAPVYTPTLTDEENVSSGRILFGGISIYLQQYSALFRRTPRFLDRLWDSRLALKAASSRSIPTDPKMLGELTISMLEGEDGVLRKEFVKLKDWLRSEPPFDVVSLPYTLLIALAPSIREVHAGPICCTLQGEDLFLDGLSEPYKSRAFDLIRRHIPDVNLFLPVSRYYAGYMTGYLGIPESRMRVAPLGISMNGHARRARSGDGPYRIGYFARIAPEKGLHVLCEAYHHLRQQPGLPPSRLVVAGYLGADHKPYLAEIERQMRAWGFGDEFEYKGVLDREAKLRFLQSLDVMSVPSVYADPKGLYVIEAMANGVPVVQPRAGAFPEMIEQTGGGLLVEHDDPASLAEGILKLWRDPALAGRLSNCAYDGVRAHYSVERMAQHVLAAYDSLCGRPRNA
ncbi:MAG: glycosyltransferase family 4 protein [Bryobacteraceae bacterium]